MLMFASAWGIKEVESAFLIRGTEVLEDLMWRQTAAEKLIVVAVSLEKNAEWVFASNCLYYNQAKMYQCWQEKGRASKILDKNVCLIQQTQISITVWKGMLHESKIGRTNTEFTWCSFK